ncbi:MAG: ABC transporter substrate-binding protein [Magnetococcales bacterium]|nr:ABC transporter substrate-binding protein [Magnetococcales bacterium]
MTPFSSRWLSRLLALLLCATLLSACGGSKFPTIRFPGSSSSGSSGDTPPPSALDERMLYDAEKLAQKGKLSEAIAQYQRFVRVYPNSDRHAEALTRMGLLFLKEGNAERAAASFSAASRHVPDPFAWEAGWRLGSLHYARGEIQEAWTRWSAVASGESPFAEDAWRRLLESYFTANDPELTLLFLGILPQPSLTPVQARQLLQKASLLSRENLQKRLTDQPPGSRLTPFLLLALGDRLMTSGDDESARVLWQKSAGALQLNAESSEISSLIANEVQRRMHGRLDLPSTVAGGSGPAAMRIGLLAPLSGRLAPLGRSVVQAAQKALSDHRDVPLSIVTADTSGDPDMAREAVNRLAAEGVQAFVGPVLHEPAKAAAAAALAHGLPIITLNAHTDILQVNADPSVTAAPVAQPEPDQQRLSEENLWSLEPESDTGNQRFDTGQRQIFLNAFHPDQQARVMARYAVMTLKRTRIAIFAPDSNYGRLTARIFAEETHSLGGTVVRTLFFSPKGPDFSKEIKKLVHLDPDRAGQRLYAGRKVAPLDPSDPPIPKTTRALDPWIDFDALFLPGTAEQVRLIAPQASFFSLRMPDVAFLGTALWNRDKLLTEGTDYLKGAVFCDTDALAKTRFRTNFKKVWGQEANPVTLLSYDGVAVVAQLLRDQRLGGPDWRSAITRPMGFNGVAGPIRFLPEGVSRRSYHLFTVTKEGIESMQPAPSLADAALSGYGAGLGVPDALQAVDEPAAALVPPSPVTSESMQEPGWRGDTSESSTTQPSQPFGQTP